MIINHNITALTALSGNAKANKAQDKAGSRLAAGLRVRGAADDSAGLAISEKMRAQIRGLSQAGRNIQDGISLAQTADGALGDIAPTMQRMRELAVEAANGTATDDDREKIQAEIEQLKKHLDEVFHNSEFNTQKIFFQMPRLTEEKVTYPIPGVITGDTILKPSGLDVTPGQNQTLSFKLDGGSYSISLNAGVHDAQQLLDDINQKLAAAGTDVTAYYSGDSIAFNSPTKIMDGFGGDMIQINNPYTSVLYDAAKHGVISGASAIGYADLSAGLTIAAGVNDALHFQVDGVTKTITLSAGTYDQAGLLTEINTQLAAANTNITASYIGNYLELMHNISGAGHTLSGINGTAYSDLFQQYTSLSESIYSGAYTTAGITGVKDLSAGLTITAGVNNSLSFNVDGVAHTITLAAGSNLSFADIVNDINTKLTAGGLPLVASDSSGYLAITYNAPGTHIVNNFHGNAADDLLYGTGVPYMQQGSYVYVEGNSTPQPNGYAFVQGVTDLSGGATIVAGVNDTFNFRVDGVNRTIVLNAGTYNQSGLLAQINSKLSGLNVSAYYYGSYLRFQNVHEGGGIPLYPYSLDTFSGNGYDALMQTVIPSPVSGANVPARVYGRADLSGGMTVTAGVNDTLIFDVNGVSKSITLAAGSYSKSALLTEINTRLTGASAGVAASYSGNTLLLTASNPGNYYIDNFSGNALDSLLRTKDYVGGAYYYPPSTSDAYIDGRLNLTDGVDIYSGANNTLSFDINGVTNSITLAAGHYDPAKLLTVLNQKLAAFDVTASYNSKNQLRLTYSPGVNGSYVIDGVSGNASYTLFYPGPTKTDITEREAEPLKSMSTYTLQVGPNAGTLINTGIPMFMSNRILGLHTVDVSTRKGADAALTAIDKAMSQVNEARANMGALENVLDATLNNVTQYNENLTASESRIRDLDMAKEQMEMVKATILSQASATVLTQAVQQPQAVLQLLRE